MPVGAYGGRREIMEMVAPLGNVYQAGTLSGNPVAMAAGLAGLHILKDHPEIYEKLNAKGEAMRKDMREILARHHAPCQVTGVGSLSCIFFTPELVWDYEGAKKSDTKAFASYFSYMLEHGIYVAPSQFEAMFLSAAHNETQIQKTLDVMEDYYAGR